MFRLLGDEIRRARFQGSFERRRCSHIGCASVGCCDTSSGRHAAGHYDETQHAVMRSIEPGEFWAWCHVDRAYISSAEAATTGH